MSRPNAFMPLYVGDYLADTAHLEAAEHGAYMLLLMHYWRAGEPITADDTQLARIARCTPKQWQRVRGAVLAFFTEKGDVLVHGRVERELERANSYYDRKMERAKAGAAKRWSKQAASNANSDAKPPDKQCFKHASSIPEAMLDDCQPQPQPHSLGKPSERGRARTCWPPDAVVPENWIKTAAEQRRLAGLAPVDLQVSARMFANFYAADVANPRTPAEFQAKWNNWALKEKPDDGHQRARRSTAGDTLRELARMASENAEPADQDVLGR